MSNHVQNVDEAESQDRANVGTSSAAGVQNFGFDHYDLSVGNSDDNAIFGGDSFNMFWGRGGNDELGSGGGDDVLFGGDGDDHLAGDDDRDHLHGDSGNDELTGGGLADDLIGGDGHDALNAGSGHDSLEGQEGDDRLIGGDGPDAFVVSPDSGHDVIEDFQAGPGLFDHVALMDLTADDLCFSESVDGVSADRARSAVYREQPIGAHSARPCRWS